MIQNNPAERSFDCEFCHGVIKVPYNLEPTKAPCPYCGEVVTSPVPPTEPVVLTPVVDEVVPAAKIPVAAASPAVPLAASPVVPSAASPAVPSAAPPAVPPAASPAVPSAAPPAVPSAAPPAVPPAVAKEVAEPEEVTAARVAGAPAGQDGAANKLPVEPVKAPEGPSKVGDGFKGETFEELAREKKPAETGRRKRSKPASAKAQRKVSPLLFLGAGAGVLLLAVGVLFILSRGKKVDPPVVALTKPDSEARKVERERYLREGWKPSASQVLSAFLEADSPDEKSKYVIGGAGRIEEMGEFYRSRETKELNTPVEAFNHEDLVMADKERGLFLMRFDRPEQFAMKDFFRPVAPLEVQHRVEDPDPVLASLADPENFTMDSVRVLAYFKEEGNELKLDWDVFVQTKYRLMREFVENPRPGASRIFRVRLHEDVAPMSGTNPTEIRYYRCIDPAHDSDFVKVAVGTASTLGQHLAPLNWIGEQKAGIPSRGATLELEWTDEEEPQVYIKRLICWEYLGLGGVLGNLQLSSGTDTAMVIPAP